jgi:hypothetical protein
LDPLTTEAEAALDFVLNGIAPPDTILPNLADQLSGDRNEFYGVPTAPMSSKEFRERHREAASQDDRDWTRDLGPFPGADPKHYHERVARFIRKHGSHRSRFFDACPVEFAFMTNDTVWWIATRQPDALTELEAHAKAVNGMSFSNCIGFAM